MRAITDPQQESEPDNICVILLKICAKQLSPIYQHLFNRSLKEQPVPLGKMQLFYPSLNLVVLKLWVTSGRWHLQIQFLAVSLCKPAPALSEGHAWGRDSSFAQNFLAPRCQTKCFKTSFIPRRVLPWIRCVWYIYSALHLTLLFGSAPKALSNLKYWLDGISFWKTGVHQSLCNDSEGAKVLHLPLKK